MKACLSQFKRSALAVAAGTTILAFAAPAIAQTYYGTIRGTVLDASGAVYPGVEITITNMATNVAAETVSNEVGNYVAPNLIPGRYRITAERAGFKRFVVEGVELSATQDFRVDIRMEVGAVTEAITVEGTAQIIETERGTLSDTKSHYVFTYTPINTDFRSLWRIMLLTPVASSATRSLVTIAAETQSSASTAFR